MGVLEFVLVAALLGALVWAINKWWPMEATIRQAMNVGAVVILVLWALSSFFPGLFGSLNAVRIGN